MSYLSISIESMAIFLAGKAVCYRILAFFCYGKLHFKCESADLFQGEFDA